MASISRFFLTVSDMLLNRPLSFEFQLNLSFLKVTFDYFCKLIWSHLKIFCSFFIKSFQNISKQLYTEPFNIVKLIILVYEVVG